MHCPLRTIDLLCPDIERRVLNTRQAMVVEVVFARQRVMARNLQPGSNRIP